MDHSRDHHSTKWIRTDIFTNILDLQYNDNYFKMGGVLENVLCVSFEHPQSHFATDIKQPYHRVLASCHQQLTIGAESPAVCGVLEPCECLYWLLRERSIDVDLSERQKRDEVMTK